MGAVTYPNPQVERFVEQHFVPVQFNVAEQPGVMEQFNSTWTPTLIVQDTDGKEHRRSHGYLDAQRFLGEMALAWLQAAIDRGDFAAARDRVPEVLDRTWGDLEREPEARYW